MTPKNQGVIKGLKIGPGPQVQGTIITIRGPCVQICEDCGLLVHEAQKQQLKQAKMHQFLFWPPIF